MATEPKRLFVYAPEMDKLGERISSAERAIEEAREQIAEMEERGDLTERIVYLVLAIRDLRASHIDHDELYVRANKALDGLRDEIPDAALAELGPAFNRPSH